MLFRKKELVERPEIEKKFSLKNPEDRAIIITFFLAILVVALIVFLIVKFGNMIPKETNSETISNLMRIFNYK